MDKSPAPDLSATPKSRLVLGAYGQPAAPNEVARTLQMPANSSPTLACGYICLQQGLTVAGTVVVLEAPER